MRPLRYSINVSLDGCVDHASSAFVPDAAVHEHAAAWMARADVALFGRSTFELMEAWRPDEHGELADWVEPWMEPFARTIGAMAKIVVSGTLDRPDLGPSEQGWNTEVVDGEDLEGLVRGLKEQPGEGIALGGVALPLALARLGLIDEYQLVVHPRIAGHGPRLLDGLAEPLGLRLVDRTELIGGVTALVHVPAG
jgi:dihydrofolate reductase